MKLSCTSVMVPGNSLEEKAEKLMGWGYTGISVFADYKGWDDAKMKEVTDLPGKTGISIGEFVFMDDLYGHLMDSDTDIKNKSRQMYKDTLAVCSEIGAVTEMEYDYGIQDPLPLFDPYQKMDQSTENEFVELISEFSMLIKGTKAFILIEPINRYETKYLTTLKDCREVLEKANQPNTGILADFFHMAIEEADLPQSILDVKGFIKHVHLGDNNRLLPGYGHTDWGACLKALKDSGFDGFLNLECGMPGPAEIELPKTAKYLQEIIDRI